MAIEVARLTEADIPAASDIIQQAFADDPYFNWVFDKDRFNKQRNNDSLYARCLWGINNALFYVARDSSTSSTSNTQPNNDDDNDSDHEPSKILGIACWLPPTPRTEPQTWTSWLNDTLLYLRQTRNIIRYLGRGGLITRRYFIWKERQAEAHRRLWDDPRGYYFCNIVAVSPDAQGRGVGKKLFEIVTRRADEEGARCYLESSKMVPNVEVYRRMGFELRMEMECKDAEGDEGCMLYCMMREPMTRN